jgi:hypothetical protein
MTALFQAVHIISLGTLHWHARLDPARWEKIHTTHSWYYPPNTRSLATSTPPKALDRRLITFPGGSLLPPSVASHASGTTGAGESSIRTRPSLLSLSSLSVGGVPWVPFRRVTTLESLNGSGWASTISILLFLPICATIESAFFFWIFLSISFVSDHTPYSLRRTNASFVTRVNSRFDKVQVSPWDKRSIHIFLFRQLRDSQTLHANPISKQVCPFFPPLPLHVLRLNFIMRGYLHLCRRSKHSKLGNRRETLCLLDIPLERGKKERKNRGVVG